MNTQDLENRYVVGLGEILFDVFPTGSKLGGAPANFAHHAGQHGLLSFLVVRGHPPHKVCGCPLADVV